MNWIKTKVHPLVGFLLALCLAGAFAFFAPLERTLGSGIRLVLFHGAWVWVGITIYAIAGILGLFGLITHRETINRYSIAAGRTGLVFWVTYLPMSLIVMQVFWNGFFFDEPRWRIPFMLGVVGLLIQVGSWMLDRLIIGSSLNVIFALVMGISMLGLTSILHPDSPVTSSNSITIQFNFVVVFIILIIAALWMIRFWFGQMSPKK